MRLDLYALAALVARNVYRQLDDYSGVAGERRDCYCENVYGLTAQGDAAEVVIWEAISERWFRLSYSLGDDNAVTFADRSAWEEVEWEWTPVKGQPSGDAERAFGPMQARKIALLTGADERAADPAQLAGVQTRRLPADEPDALGVYRQRSLTAEVRRADGENRTTLVINTDAVDNHRTIIDPAGGEWDEFRGRFLINHDPNLLAGESPTPELRDGQWVVSVDDDAWDHDDPQIERWFNKVKRGLCREISLGFRPIDGRWETVETDGRSERVFRFTRWKGLEWSFVGLASNAEAVVTERDLTTTRGARPARRVAEAAPVETEPAPPAHVFTPAQIRAAAEERRQRLRRAVLAKRGQA